MNDCPRSVKIVREQGLFKLGPQDRPVVAQSASRGVVLARVLLNPSGALAWLKDVPRPDRWADYCTGVIHMKAIPPRYDEAQAAFERGAEQGSPDAMCSLGSMILNGHARVNLSTMPRGDPPLAEIRRTLALRLYERAAIHNLPRALCCLGSMYSRYQMFGCKSEDEARKRYKEAADRGFKPAADLLNLC